MPGIPNEPSTSPSDLLPDIHLKPQDGGILPHQSLPASGASPVSGVPPHLLPLLLPLILPLLLPLYLPLLLPLVKDLLRLGNHLASDVFERFAFLERNWQMERRLRRGEIQQLLGTTTVLSVWCREWRRYQGLFVCLFVCFMFFSCLFVYLLTKFTQEERREGVCVEKKEEL